MTSAERLESSDRCLRSAYLSKTWQRNVLSPTAALYQAIETGLIYSGPEDPGQCAGDTLMTLAVDRGLDTHQSDLFGLAQHLAAIADLCTWMLRTGAPWPRPENIKVGDDTWESSAFLNEAGTRLRRIVLVDRWSEERQLSVEHNWNVFGETCSYQMPMDLTVLVLGQMRDGRRHGPFSKAWTHPISKQLRMRKRSGKGFDGNWIPVFREDWEGSREGWLDTMTEDGVLEDAVFHVEVQPHEEAKKIRSLIERRLTAIHECNALPDPCPSQCYGLSPCQFIGSCWEFKPPSVRDGFVRIK